MPRNPFDIAVDPPPEVSALSASMRRLVDSLLAVEMLPDALAGELRALRARVDAAAGHMEKLARPERTPRHRYDRKQGVRPYYVRGALIGPQNPLVPPIRISHADGVTSGTVRFGVAYEGPPGCVHGGFLALVCDQILGHHNLECAIPAMTGTLEVRYLGPTPLLTELRFQVRTASASKRKVVNEAWIESEGGRVCQARGIFILPRESNYMGKMSRRLPPFIANRSTHK